MTPSSDPRRIGVLDVLTQSLTALRLWNGRQIITAAATGVAIALVVGYVTVLIPNEVFARDIPPVWWNYPVWIVTSALSGMLLATYVAPRSSTTSPERRGGRLGMAGGVMAWFAVGCPVCNKLALLALGYAGAITWFAPMQGVLAVTALVLTVTALVGRLRGQIACPVRPSLRMVP